MEEVKTSANYDAVDLLKIILAFFIIQIHSSFYFDWMKPIIRIAVPVYFITSAFFFFEKEPDPSSDCALFDSCHYGNIVFAFALDMHSGCCIGFGLNVGNSHYEG